MSKKIVINKFLKYIEYLSAANRKYELVKEECSDIIKVNSIILKILEKRSKNIRVDKKEYLELAQYECPCISMISMEDIDPEKENYRISALMNDDDSYLFDCPDTSCEECWKNHIDTVVDYFNREEIIIKNL